MLDECLSIPIKCQGYLDMFDGINITQTRDYIKINCHSFVEKACEKYLTSCMHTIPLTDNRPTPLPPDSTWLKKFNAAIGLPDKTEQDQLAKAIKLNYRGGVGELIWAMTTCRPNLAFTSIKLSQLNSVDNIAVSGTHALESAILSSGLQGAHHRVAASSSLFVVIDATCINSHITSNKYFFL